MTLQFLKTAMEEFHTVASQLEGVQGVDYGKIWSWMQNYAIPDLVKVLKIVGPQLLSGGLTWANAVVIIEQLLISFA